MSYAHSQVMTPDWQRLFVPEMALLEVILRGTLMYFGLLAALRILVRRHVGSLSLMDLLLVVLIADAAQNAMADEYHSLTEGAVLCGTLIGWNYFLDWMAYRYESIAALLEPAPLPVVQNGRLQRRNMRQEFITEDELRSQLRQQGVEDVSKIKIAHLEPDGGISVIFKDGTPSPTANSKQKRAAGT